MVFPFLLIEFFYDPKTYIIKSWNKNNEKSNYFRDLFFKITSTHVHIYILKVRTGRWSSPASQGGLRDLRGSLED